MNESQKRNRKRNLMKSLMEDNDTPSDIIIYKDFGDSSD